MFKGIVAIILMTSIASVQASAGLQAVVFDWAGTTQDYGSRAPIEAFKKVFAEEGVFLSDAEIKVPMGVYKRTHIEMLTQLPAMDVENTPVAVRWARVHDGKMPTTADIDRMFTRFIPIQLSVLKEYSMIIPGTRQTVDYIHQKGWKVGSTTGYSTEMLDIVRQEARQQGYEPDFAIASDKVAQGRPYPDMILKNCEYFGVEPKNVVVVDDSMPGIEAAHRAGAWTVLVLQSGSQLGLSEDAVKALSPAVLQKKLQEVRDANTTFVHYQIPTIAELPQVLEEIDQFIRKGYTPQSFSATNRPGSCSYKHKLLTQ